MVSSIAERWHKTACFRQNTEGGWDFYPWPETRLGYRIDDTAKLRLERIEAKAMRFFWLLFALPLLSIFTFNDPGRGWLADIAPGLTPHWAVGLSFLVMFVLMSYWANAVHRRQVEALADLAPTTVVLSPEDYRRTIARQLFYGHPKAYAVLGALFFALITWMIFINGREPDRFSLLPIFLPGAWLVLRAWRLIFSAASI